MQTMADTTGGTRTVQGTKLSAATKKNKAILLLWITQGLLAALFLFAGGMKLVLPLQVLAQQSHMSGLFMKFIGLAEVAGAIGLILPGVLRIRQELTPLAAAGLVTIMTGATVVTLAAGSVTPALIPFVVGLLSAFVAYGRRGLMQLRRSAERSREATKQGDTSVPHWALDPES